MKEMIKREDGSYSQRGLWDNIRKAAAENRRKGKKGKKPTKQMLEQERKIKANERKSKSGSSRRSR
jgi:hypothetical protein